MCPGLFLVLMSLKLPPYGEHQQKQPLGAKSYSPDSERLTIKDSARLKSSEKSQPPQD